MSYRRFVPYAFPAVAVLTACSSSTPRQAAPALPPGMTAAPLADDRDAARLCGYLASQPETPMRFPWPPAHDTSGSPVLLAYVAGPYVRGMRVVLPGAPSRYLFRGVDSRGGQRLTFERDVPDLATPAALAMAEARVPASLRALDSLAANTLPPRGDTTAKLPAVWPDTLIEADRAVPDLHRLPESRIVLDDACPIATIGTQAVPRIDRILRVDVPAGRTLHVRARGSSHGLVMAIDAPATPDSARSLVRWTVQDSVRVAEARTVSVRLRTVPKARDTARSSFVLVTVLLR